MYKLLPIQFHALGNSIFEFKENNNVHNEKL